MDYFINEKGTTKPVAKVLTKSLTKYPDIQAEFVEWIAMRNYDFPSPLTIEGYTAKQIHEIEPSLDAAGVYNFMVTLRDDPEKARDYIKRGFPTK